MFRKLKLKFILTNVVTLTVVLLMIFSGMYFSMRGFLKFQADMILYTIAEEESLNPNFDPALVRFFFTKVNATGEIIGHLSVITVSTEDMGALKERS